MTNFLQTSKSDSSQQGQALVEFALVLIFIILPITFVIVDGALTLFTLTNVTNAVREGTRAGAIYQTSTAQQSNQSFEDYQAQIDTERRASIQAEIQNRLGPLVGCAAPTITYSPATPQAGNPYRASAQLTVNLTCTRRLLFGLVNAATIDLKGSATMRIEPGGVRNP